MDRRSAWDTSDVTGAARSRPTMRHVAALAGVGIKTVSRVVNGEPNVSDAMTERVREAVERLDYQLDLNAGNLKRAKGRTLTIGLLVGSFTNAFSGSIHRGIERQAWARDTAVFASSLDDGADREESIVRAFRRRRVDGMILSTAGGSGPYLSADAARRTPLVFIGQAPTGVGADAVNSDDFTGAAQGARHILQHGHRRIAYCSTDCSTGDNAGNPAARERYRGFMEELGAAGVPAADVRVLQDLNDAEAVRNAVAALLRSPSPPTAIFASNSIGTIGAMRAVRESGVEGAVALVGFDDSAFVELIEPGVTVVAQDPEGIGQVAAERLFARVDGSQEEPHTYTVPTMLIARGSGELRTGA